MIKETAKFGLKAWLIVVAIILFISIGGCVAKAVLFPAHVANKAIDTAAGVFDQTLNANNALFNYENFKDLYNGAKAQVMNIVSIQQSIDQLKEDYGDPVDWTKDVRDDANFLKQSLEGYKMQYQSLVKQYNSDSSKLNRNLFKDKGLPDELPLDYMELK